MAIRNLKGIDNAKVEEIEKQRIMVEQVKSKLLYYNNFILDMSQDIIDAIDTFNYCETKGIKKIVNEYSKTVKRIGIKDNMVYFQYNVCEKENTGPYNWYVCTDGHNVYVKEGNDKSNVLDMARKAYYRENRVVAPIVNDMGWHTCHNSQKPLSVLEDFCCKLKPFLTYLFKDIDNL